MLMRFIVPSSDPDRPYLEPKAEHRSWRISRRPSTDHRQSLHPAGHDHESPPDSARDLSSYYLASFETRFAHHGYESLCGPHDLRGLRESQAICSARSVSESVSVPFAARIRRRAICLSCAAIPCPA